MKTPVRGANAGGGFMAEKNSLTNWRSRRRGYERQRKTNSRVRRPKEVSGKFGISTGNKWKRPMLRRCPEEITDISKAASARFPLGRWGRFFSCRDAALLPRLSILRPRPFGNVRREVFGPLQYPEMEKDYYCDAEYGCSC
jgi:hypothetical protein